MMVRAPLRLSLVFSFLALSCATTSPVLPENAAAGNALRVLFDDAVDSFRGTATRVASQEDWRVEAKVDVCPLLGSPRGGQATIMRWDIENKDLSPTYTCELYRGSDGGAAQRIFDKASHDSRAVYVGGWQWKYDEYMRETRGDHQGTRVSVTISIQLIEGVHVVTFKMEQGKFS